jgi:putative oxidoreductase
VSGDGGTKLTGQTGQVKTNGEATMQVTDNAAILIGRILMSLLFVLHGWGKLMAPAATQAAFAKYNLPMIEAAWVIAVVAELGGGLAILVGLFARPVALAMAAWCVATALVAHTNLADRAQEIQFFKNMGLAGGFLYVAAFGAGAWSLDAWRSGRRGAVAVE